MSDSAPDPYKTMNPEDSTLFRVGQLLLLLRRLDALEATATTMERLGYYDFFSANPFLLFPEGTRERRVLRLAGLSSRSLSYASSGQRWTTRRQRLQHDVALLVAHGLVRRVVADGRVTYKATERGVELAESMRSLYAASYAQSAELVIAKLTRLSEGGLVTLAEELLRRPGLVIDIYGEDDATGDLSNDDAASYQNDGTAR